MMQDDRWTGTALSPALLCPSNHRTRFPFRLFFVTALASHTSRLVNVIDGPTITVLWLLLLVTCLPRACSLAVSTTFKKALSIYSADLFTYEAEDHKDVLF